MKLKPHPWDNHGSWRKQSFGGWNFGWPASTVGILSKKANDILFAGCLPFSRLRKAIVTFEAHIGGFVMDVLMGGKWSNQWYGIFKYYDAAKLLNAWLFGFSLIWFNWINFSFSWKLCMVEAICSVITWILFSKVFIWFCLFTKKKLKGGYHVTQGRRLERSHQVPISLSLFGSWDAGTQPMDMFFWTSFKVYITVFVPET